MNRLIRIGLRRGWRQGVLGGDRTWLYVGVGAMLLRMLLRAWAKEEHVVYREVLAPGQRLVITHEPPS